MNRQSVRSAYEGRNVFQTFLILIYLIFNHVSGSGGSTTTIRPPEETLLEILTRPVVPTDDASADCLRDSAIYLMALGNYTPWALQMYDASAKIPPGVITGNIKQLGNYDECLRVRNSFGFTGQSCTASVNFVVHQNGPVTNQTDMKDLILNVAAASGQTNWTHGTTVTYEWTWCVPSTCTYAEILDRVEILVDPLRVEGRVDIDVTMKPNSCHTTETDIRKLDVADWIYITLLILFAVITIVSTTIDLMMQEKYQEKRKDTKQIVLTSFSLYTNGKSLLNSKRREDSIACLDGLRYISICWIIYGHTQYLSSTGIQLDVSQVSVMHEEWSTMLVLNGNIVTDTFFLLSGLLLAYTKFSQKQRNPGTTLNLVELYIHRYFRLTPAYAMVIGFYATIYYKLGTGPEWDSTVGANRDYCRENWWTNLLYVNNMVNVPNMCMSQTWYLSVDMQLVWISPIFLYPMLKFSRAIIFWVILGIGFVISIVVPFVITYTMELSGTMIFYKDQMGIVDVFMEVYTKTYARAGPYIVGMGLGYMLCKFKSMSINVPKIYVICGWLVAAVFLGTSVFGARGMYFDDHVYNKLEASMYAAFHRTVFSLAVSWIIFACVYGVAGPINALLSWSGWVPLAKLSYSAYLTHYIVLYYNIGTTRTPGNLTSYTVIHNFLGNLALSMCLAVILNLIFEMPFMVLDSVMRRNKRRPSDSKASVPATAKLDDGNEIYRTIDDSLSSVSQMYTEIVDITKPDDGSYVTSFDPSSGYYVDQMERAMKNENVYTYVVGSRLGSPPPPRKNDDATGSKDDGSELRADILTPVENVPATESLGVDNRAYQA